MTDEHYIISFDKPPKKTRRFWSRLPDGGGYDSITDEVPEVVQQPKQEINMQTPLNQLTNDKRKPRGKTGKFR